MKGILNSERKNSQIQSIKIINLKEKNELHSHRETNINFTNQIDDLNLKFYLEAEKYLNNKENDSQCQKKLFSILFKEINIYNKEIKRLNAIISESRNKNENLTIKDNIIKSLKESENLLEKCLSERIESENKLRIENAKLKKENEEYKKKINELTRKENRIMSDITKAESNDIEILNKDILSKSTYSNGFKKKNKKQITINSKFDDFYSKRILSISRNNKNKSIKSKYSRGNKTFIK